MIFNNNSTSLGNGVPMAEGYDCSYGAALALVESAQNEYAMFKAMLAVDAKEISMNESGVVTESEVYALQEAAVSGIWAKIKELFSKLAGKIKAIFHNFVAKISGLFMSDKAYVKKYSAEVVRKTNIGNLEVKWCKIKNSPLQDMDKVTDIDAKLTELKGLWREDVEGRQNAVVGSLDIGGVTDIDTFGEDMDKYFFEDQETVKISEINGGIRSIIKYLEDANSKISKLKTSTNKVSSSLDKLVREADKRAKEAAKDFVDKKEGVAETSVEEANKTFDMAQVYQTVVLKQINCVLAAVKKEYKQYKAAFAKAVTANNDKLKESAVFAEAVAEAAAEEVEDVMNGAISADDSNIADLSAADTNLVGTTGEKEGCEKEDNSGVKAEAAYFGSLIY